MISVQVKSFVKELIAEPQQDLEVGEGLTIRELLLQLGQNQDRPAGKKLLNPETGELNKPYVVFVNGRVSFSLPGGIGASLRDGDIISIMLPIAGG